MELIRTSSLTKTYAQGDGTAAVLDRCDLSIAHGDFVAIMGPSGSGKSTLMHILGLLDKATDGEYYFDGTDVQTLSRNQCAKRRAQDIGFVFQNYGLIADYTAQENIEMALHYKGLSPRESRQKASEVLQRLGLDMHGHKRPAKLSGGQQQRVAIGRALAGAPKLLLADEPTGALDRRTGEEVMEMIGSLHATGMTVMIVTHDVEVASYAKRTIRMEDGRVTS